MPCEKCKQEGRRHPWCIDCPMGDGGSFQDLSEGQVDVPWALDPPAWLMEDWATPVIELPDLDIRDGELENAVAPGLHVLASVATAIESEASSVHFEPMDLINGVKLECDEDARDLTTVELDRDQFERCRSPNEELGRIGPNSPVKEETTEEVCRDEALNDLMRAANELARALSVCRDLRPLDVKVASSSEGRCIDCTRNGPCMRSVCTVAPDIETTEPPQSPDPDSEHEWQSESSDNEGYRPVVSPVSPAERPFELAPGAGCSQKSDYELGPSQAQKFWSKKMQRSSKSTGARRVATIVPRTS